MLNNLDSRIARIFLEAGMTGVDGSERLFYNGADQFQIANLNTVMNFGFSSANFTVRGSRRVQFNKVKLNNMFRGVSAEVFLYTPRTTHEVAAELIRRYGLPLNLDWFVNTPIPTEVGNSPDFTIKLYMVRTLFNMEPANQDEALSVRVRQADVDLKDIFKKVDLSTPKLPFTIRAGYTNTEYLTYGKDFSPETVEKFALLKAIAASEDLYGFEYPSSDRSAYLVELMNSRLDIEVTTEGDQDGKLSLKNAVFVHNGPTVGFPKADTWYDNVLVFDTVLDPMDSSARDYRGRCYVHYNNVS